jgi:hypothetical protein
MIDAAMKSIEVVAREGGVPTVWVSAATLGTIRGTHKHLLTKLLFCSFPAMH